MTERTNLGETADERRLIDDLWENLDVTETAISVMREDLRRGDYHAFLTVLSALMLALMLTGDHVMEGLLTDGEKEEFMYGEAGSELQLMAQQFFQELKAEDDVEK